MTEESEVMLSETPEEVVEQQELSRRPTTVDHRDLLIEQLLRDRGANGCGCGGAVPAQGNAGTAASREPPRYVYAIGEIDVRTASLGVEKELVQATGRAETANLTDRQALHEVLSARENRYLARQMCYVLTIRGIDVYLVRPRVSTDLDLLLEAAGQPSRPTRFHVVIGTLGPVAPPEYCNGMMLPIATFDQLYSFDADELIQALPRPDNLSEDRFDEAAHELFERIMQITDNAGASDEHRALNYVAVRYAGIYTKTAEAHAAGSSLTAIETRMSRLSINRKIVDVVFSYTNRTSLVSEKFFLRVDVTDENPFPHTRLAPYYDR